MDKTEAENLDSENYKVHAFTDDLSLVYSKTQGDNLPIIGTQIAEDKPCYIPGQFQSSTKIFHKAEIDRSFAECTRANGYQIDSRYEKIGDY